MKKLLHVGCGLKHLSETTQGFGAGEWQEIRLDIDASVQPDILASTTDMSGVETASVDAIFSAHNLEHLYAYQVPIALAEFRRVLKPDGFAVITCPDLRAICALVAEDKLLDPFGQSPAGPIAPMDVLYGYRPALAQGAHSMAHRCGFTAKVLTQVVRAAGFVGTASARRGHPSFDLWLVATVSLRTRQQLNALARQHFPGMSE